MKRSGFTLVEILVAFGILALVMGVVYSSVTSSLYATRYVGERAELYHAGRQIISRLMRELSSAYLDGGGSTFFKGEHDQVEGRRMDRLAFTTLGHRMIPFPVEGHVDSEYAAAAYYWKIEYQEARGPLLAEPVQGEEIPLLTLFYREDTGFGPEAGGEEYELVQGLRELDIRYFQGSTGAWVDEWDSKLTGGIPTAADISLVLTDSSGVEVPFRALVPLMLAK